MKALNYLQRTEIEKASQKLNPKLRLEQPKLEQA